MSARAQQSERMRRIGVFMVLAAADPENQARLAVMFCFFGGGLGA
jgi:hypothetical protein